MPAFQTRALLFSLLTETDVQEIVGLDPLELLTTKESDTRPRPQAGAGVCAGRKPQGRNFTSHRRCAESGNSVLSKGRRGWGGNPKSLPVLVLL